MPLDDVSDRNHLGREPLTTSAPTNQNRQPLDEDSDLVYEDELLWGDDPNKHYFAYFMDHENNAAKRGDKCGLADALSPLRTCLNIRGDKPLSESTRTSTVPTYRSTTSCYRPEEQALESPLKKSSPTKTSSPLGVDALWGTDGMVRARYADVPSVVFVEGSFEKDVQSDDDDFAITRNRLGCSRGTAFSLLIALILCLVGVVAGGAVFLLKGDSSQKQYQQEDTDGVQLSRSPSLYPSEFPSLRPSKCPSVRPTTSPSIVPSKHPTAAPSTLPSISASQTPSIVTFMSYKPSTSFSRGPSTLQSPTETTIPSTFISPTTTPTKISKPASPSPSESPTVVVSSWPFGETSVIDPALIRLVLELSSHDQGASVSTPNTPQNEALLWLAKDPSLDAYSDAQKVQRYVLATLFFSTNGPTWIMSDGWLSNDGECTWYGFWLSCDDAGVLNELDLRENNMSGTLPIELSWLDSLLRLNFRDNQISGQIPTEFGRLSSMIFLQFSSNQLTGTLPTELATLDSLGAFVFDVSNCLLSFNLILFLSIKFAETLGLAENDLVGTIPVEYADLDRLERLRLESNDLSGTIPVEMSDMTNLVILSLNNNVLTGTVPTELGSLSLLEDLAVNSNFVTGLMPPVLCSMGNLSIVADCDEIYCPCCSECCDQDGCAQQ